MKSVRLIIAINPKNEADPFNYITGINQVMRAPLNPQQGISIDEMKQSLKVLDKLDKCEVGDTLELEDAEWEFLCSKVRAARWGIVDSRLVAFSEDILGAL